MDAERMQTSSFITVINAEWSFWGDTLSFFANSVELDVGITWAYSYSVFTWYIVEVDDKDLGLPSQYVYLRCFGGGRQSSLTVKTFMEVISSRGWGDEVRY